MNVKKTIKIVSINIVLLFSLLGVLEFASYSWMAYNKIKNQGKEYINPKSTLINYQDSTWTKHYFQEQGKTGAKYKSFIGWIMKQVKGKYINIDQEGSRYTFPFDSSRINMPTTVFSGGSTIYGTGAPDEYSIPSFYSKVVSDENVLNFGQAGYSSYQSLQYLEYRLMKGLEFDKLICYEGVNNSPRAINFSAHTREEFIQFLTNGSERTKYKNAEFLPNTKKVFGFTDKFRGTKKESTPERNQMAAKFLLESWVRMKRICEYENAEFICILQPNAMVGKPNLSNLENSAMKDWRKNKEKSYDYYADILRLMSTEKYSELLPHFINMTNTLDGAENVYIDFCHLSPNGNKIIVDKMIEEFKSLEIRNQSN